MNKRRTLAWLLPPMACVCLLSMQGSLAQGANADRVESTRAALEKWVETKRIISKEQREWELGRELLGSRIDLIRSEIDDLREKIGEAESKIADADTKRDELLGENERLKEASSALDATVLTLEQRTKELLTRLPATIRDKVKPLSQRFPEDPAKTKMSLGERFQNVVGVLNAVNKFNREITLTIESRTLPDGTIAQVQTVYIGISYGYYTTTNGDQAGIGRSTPEGWTWTPANEAAAEIAEAILILKNEAPADFVRLPVQVD